MSHNGPSLSPRTDIDLPEPHGESTTFPRYLPVEGTAAFGDFIASVRRLQDLVCHTDLGDDHAWKSATTQIDRVSTMLATRKVEEGMAPGGRALNLPGLGNPLLPAWQITAATAQSVSFEGSFSRFFMGANNIVLGGVLPLLFDWCFAIAVTAAGRPMSRTAYLNVDYRGAVYIDTTLTINTCINEVAGRKTRLAANLQDAHGTVLADAETLVIALRRDQA